MWGTTLDWESRVHKGENVDPILGEEIDSDDESIVEKKKSPPPMWCILAWRWWII